MAEESIVVIPTFNERENIRPLCAAVREVLPSAHLLFVDDNSPDGTAAAVEELGREHPGEIHLLWKPEKEGLGRAYCQGFRWALGRSYTHIFQMDADFSHDPHDLPRLLAPLVEGTADFALGSRYVPGGDAASFTAARRLVSQGGSLYARLVLGVKVRDLTGGFKCWKREVLQAIDLDAIGAKGYGFQVETTYRALRKGFRAVEVPIRFGHRAAGVSKMSGGIFLEALLMVWRLRWRVR